jgi:VRR-NUC domain
MPTTTLASMTEQELLDNVLEMARLFGWRVAHFRPAMTKHGWRTPVSADGKGFPDLVLVRDRVIFVELKAAKGHMSPEQLDWMAAFSNANAECHVWRPIDWLDGTIETALRSRP